MHIFVYSSFTMHVYAYTGVDGNAEHRDQDARFWAGVSEGLDYSTAEKNGELLYIRVIAK